MDPNNTQQPVPVVNQQMPQVATVSEQVGNPVPKSNKKFLLYGILLGLIIVALVGVVGFYVLYGAKKTTNNSVAAVPTSAQTVTVTAAPVAAVNNTSDLDGLLVGLAQADNSLNSEVTSLDKDSNF